MEIGPTKPDPGRLSPRGEVEEKVKAIQKKIQALMKKVEAGTDPGIMQDIHNQLKKYQEEIIRLTASAAPSRLQTPTKEQQDAIELAQALHDDLEAFKQAVKSGGDLYGIRDKIGNVLNELEENRNGWIDMDPEGGFSSSLDVIRLNFNGLSKWVDIQWSVGPDALLMVAGNMEISGDYILKRMHALWGGG